ncbi:NfeD family protein [Leptospira sp. 96542]|nr:NfeD family protein [Leptospira sp. 96542]
MDFIFANAPYVWIVLGIFLLVSEFLLPGTFVMFLGIGAVITGIASRLIHMEFYTQIIVWVFTSFISLLVGGAAIKKFFKSESSVDPYVKEDYIGQIVPVEVDILVETLGGKIRFQGTVWDAISLNEKIPKGSYVRILSRTNLTFTVELVNS